MLLLLTDKSDGLKCQSTMPGLILAPAHWLAVFGQVLKLSARWDLEFLFCLFSPRCSGLPEVCSQALPGWE